MNGHEDAVNSMGAAVCFAECFATTGAAPETAWWLGIVLAALVGPFAGRVYHAVAVRLAVWWGARIAQQESK